MNNLAPLAPAPNPAEASSARRLLDPLTQHDALLRYFRDIKFESVKLLQPLGQSLRADAGPRATRRLAELPSQEELRNWYFELKAALDTAPDDASSRELVTLMLTALRGKLQDPDAVIDSFVISIADARLSPQIVAGAIKRAWLKCKTKPSVQAFMQICEVHQREIKLANDDVVRAIGLRKDADKVAGRSAPLLAVETSGVRRLR